MGNLSKIRKSFEALAKELQKKFPDADIHLDIEEDRGTYNVSFVGLKPGTTIDDDPLPEETYFTLYRDIYPGKWMDLELFVIDEAFQGKGIAKLIHKSHFELAKALKIPKMDMFANVDIGGYAWIRSGFTPTKPKAFQNSIRNRWVKMGSSKEYEQLIEEVMSYTPEELVRVVRANPPRS